MPALTLPSTTQTSGGSLKMPANALRYSTRESGDAKHWSTTADALSNAQSQIDALTSRINQLIAFVSGSGGTTPSTLIVNVLDYGAKGDGVTDDTAAIKLALATGKSIFFPATTTYYKISSPLNLTAVGQAIYGVGHLSKIVQTGVDVNATVFQAESLGYNEFSGLYIVPGSTVSGIGATVLGFAIRCHVSDYCHVRYVEASGHRKGAILLWDSNYCSVEDNLIHNSVVVNTPTTSDTAGTAGNDIYLYGSCSYNRICNNTMRNGAGFGIGVQTAATGTDHGDHNLIRGNVIDGEPCYGIYFYRSAAADTVWHNECSGNQVSNISGNIPLDPTKTGVVASSGGGTAIAWTSGDDFTTVSVGNVVQISHTSQTVTVKTDSTHITVTPGLGGSLSGLPWSNALRAFGSGIYVASAEYTLISTNVVTNTNVFQPPDQTNGAAAINVTGAAAVKVIGNEVYSPGWNSFSAILSVAPAISGGVSEWIDNSSESSSSAACMTVRDVPMLKVNGLHGYHSSVASTAIDDQQAFIDQSELRSYDHLDFENYAAGLVQSTSVGTIKRTCVTNSVIRHNTGYAVLSVGVETVIDSVNVHQDNLVVASVLVGGIGLGVTAAVTTGRMSNNFIRGGKFGIVNDAGPTFLLDHNDVGNPFDAGSPATGYSGGRGTEFPLEASATPTVAGQAQDFRIEDNATRTDFLHGTPGQIINLRATLGVTIQNNANIQLAGSQDFVMANNDVLTLKFATSSWFEPVGRVVAILPTLGISGTFTMRNAAGTGTGNMVFVNGLLQSSTL